MEKIVLYHTSFDVIENPDIKYGRKNADFGQGFYTTPNKDFAERWAKIREGQSVYLNMYELCLDGLNIKNLCRDDEWFNYIYNNRGGIDLLENADIVIGPIANDTLYDVFGVTTSGMLTKKQSLDLLMIGPEYTQVAIKTEKAASQLKWMSAQTLHMEDVAKMREVVLAESEAYQKEFGDALSKLLD